MDSISTKPRCGLVSILHGDQTILHHSHTPYEHAVASASKADSFDFVGIVDCKSKDQKYIQDDCDVMNHFSSCLVQEKVVQEAVIPGTTLQASPSQMQPQAAPQPLSPHILHMERCTGMY